MGAKRDEDGTTGGNPCGAPPDGISVVICSYNGASRIPRVLDHLASQDPPAGLRWEVVVVDNGSTDATAEVARSYRGLSVPLRVISESRSGVTFARARGIEEARYELISFVDDDNWLAPQWLEFAIDVFSRHPEIGALGGQIVAVCEITPPRWFDRYQEFLAIGPNFPGACDVTENPGVLWTAGMTLRKRAWENLRKTDFHFTMTGHQGARVSAGGDNELCCALRLAGWRLFYDPRLRLHHFLPASRLNWDHIRRRARASGSSSALLDPYFVALRRANGVRRAAWAKLIDRMPSQWLWRALWEARPLIRRPLTLCLMPLLSLEGSESVIKAEMAIGRLQLLLRNRSAYDHSIQRVCDMRWNQPPAA